MAAATVSKPVTSATSSIVAALSTPHRAVVAVQHTPPKRFRAGAPVVIEASLPTDIPGKLNLCYRRVNQAEKWVTVTMEPRPEIPAEYVASPYPLQYYFEVLPEAGGATLYPGIARDYSTQPYYLIRKG
jgi:hypothetical protein